MFCVIINRHKEINIMSIRALQDYTFYAKYAKYNKDKKRRETWQETVDRVFEMHERKFKDILEKNENFRKDFNFAKEQVLKKRVLGAQRALQFGGDPILKKNAKMYNCSVSYIDRTKAFQECMYLLLCGCGVGFSVQDKHINKLPNIETRTKGKKTFIVEDTIESWSDSIGVLVNSYFSNNDNIWKDYQGFEIDFDLSNIRPEGAPITGGFKAPGSKGLEVAISKIKAILDYRISLNENRMHAIDAYDIIMHASDAVLSGGIRRSATICIFSKSDNEMLKAKTGDWFIKNPQRGRSNNSVALIKDKTTREEFYEIMEFVKEFGEPGFVWLDNEDIVYNPCQPSWATVLTPNGISTIGDIKEGDKIWSETGWTNVIKKWSTGIKKVYNYRTTSGNFYGTENHRLISNGEKIEAKDCESIDILHGEYKNNISINIQDVMDGLVFGDGSVHEASNNLVYLIIGEHDNVYFNSEISNLIIKDRNKLHHGAYEITTTIKNTEIPLTYNRIIPSRFIYENKNKVCGFLRGLYSANGSICGKRVTLKASSFNVIEKVQLMLSSIGIRSYYTTNKSNTIQFSNGTYTCRKSYDLNITTDIDKFSNIIGFIQNYKTEKLNSILENKKEGNFNKKTYDIINNEFISEEEVFDITVDNNTHTYWTGGVNVSNCVEIGMIPRLETGESGVQFCNLTEINAKKIKSLEDFLQAARAGAIIGTMQAAYTDFPYLGKISEDIVKKEALLGVSMTGMMDSPDIIFNEEYQRLAALEVLKVNEIIAGYIGINPCARATCVKPAGSTSCILGSASGVHPHHAKRYFRRVQANRLEFPLRHFMKTNPLAVEKSVWSANNTDYVINFLCEVPLGSITKNQIKAVDLLEKVKLTQKNWVEYGTRPERCTDPSVRHNVSNTITVKPEEWDDVSKFIYDNKKWFAGISLLPASGDKDYPQAPFCSVPSITEYNSQYGEAGLFASGLIVDGLKAFNDNLWAACDAIVGIGEKLEEIEEPIEPKQPKKNGYTDKEYIKKLKEHTIKFYTHLEEYEKYEIIKLKLDWIRRARQFADRYFNGVNSIKQMTYCLKDCHNIKLWNDLSREYKDIDWSDVIESEHSVNIDSLGAQSCSGGKCELI